MTDTINSHRTQARGDRFRPLLSWRVLGVLLVVVALMLGPQFMYPTFLMKIMCFGLFAAAFNLVLGYTGLLSFGHAMFFGGASYTTAYLLKVQSVSLEVAIIGGAFVAGVMGLACAILAIRKSGIYFAMVTLAAAQLFFFFCLQSPFTGGEDGIQAVPRTLLLGHIDLDHDTTLYYAVMVIFLGGLFTIYRTVHSHFGHVLRAIRENEPRAISLGYDVNYYKTLAFVISATLAGLAGATKAVVFQLASLTDVGWQMSGEVILMTLIGGVGTLLGPILGATIVVTMQSYLAGMGEWILIIQGIIFVAVVSVFRRGIVGTIGHAFRKARCRAKPVR